MCSYSLLPLASPSTRESPTLSPRPRSARSLVARRSSATPPPQSSTTAKKPQTGNREKEREEKGERERETEPEPETETESETESGRWQIETGHTFFLVLFLSLFSHFPFSC
jgi:hypothetical protein